MPESSHIDGPSNQSQGTEKPAIIKPAAKEGTKVVLASQGVPEPIAAAVGNQVGDAVAKKAEKSRHSEMPSAKSIDAKDTKIKAAALDSSSGEGVQSEKNQKRKTPAPQPAAESEKVNQKKEATSESDNEKQDLSTQQHTPKSDISGPASDAIYNMMAAFDPSVAIGGEIPDSVNTGLEAAVNTVKAGVTTAAKGIQSWISKGRESQQSDLKATPAAIPTGNREDSEAEKTASPSSMMP